MWLPLNLHGIRAPHASFRLKPEATRLRASATQADSLVWLPALAGRLLSSVDFRLHAKPRAIRRNDERHT
jgi:hypothetical protein